MVGRFVSLLAAFFPYLNSLKLISGIRQLLLKRRIISLYTYMNLNLYNTCTASN